MLRQVHFLLTYNCNFECDHCFLHCSPRKNGTFSLNQLREALDQIVKLGTVDWVYFEGGEPFLYYPLMLKGIEMARARGLKTGLVTNGYWATADEDAEVWLGALRELEVADLSISDDALHYGEESETPAKRALTAAARLGIPAWPIRIEPPTVVGRSANGREKGTPIVGGSTMFRGRAAEKLTEGLPRQRWQEFAECPYEDLEEPGRVHLDWYGNVHLCQGLIMGNIWETPLAELVREYNADSHPICGPLVRGGPALLASKSSVAHEDEYVDACHFCYSLRRTLASGFPRFLGPRKVYGLD